MTHPKEYLALPGISASDMKLFEESPWLFHKKQLGEFEKSDSTEATEIGDITDLLLTKPAEISENEIVKDFYVLNQWKATEKVKEVIDYIIALALEDEEIKYDPEVRNRVIRSYFETDRIVEKAVDHINYQANWKNDTRVKKIREVGIDYLEQMIEANGRPIIEGEYLQLAKDMIYQAEQDEYTGIVMQRLRTDNTALRQHLLHGTHEVGLQLRGLLDFAFVDGNSITPWDVKTAKSPEGFMRNYFQSRYYRQGANYTYLLQKMYPTHTIRPFRFFVLFKEKIRLNGEERFKYAPRIYEMSNYDLQIGMFGGNRANGAYVKGIMDILSEIKWHQNAGQWEHPMDLYINNGVIPLNSFTNIEERPVSETHDDNNDFTY
jgi:hypothetical protein